MGNDTINGNGIGDAGNNETIAQFFTIGASTPTLITGSTGLYPDEADWYRFVAPSTGPVLFNLSGLNGDLDLYLYDSLGTELAYGINFDTVDENFIYTVSQGGTYYIEVYPFDSASNYSLTVEYSSAPPPQGGHDIVNGLNILDAGNTQPLASTISLDVLGDAKITGSTGSIIDIADWYSFQPEHSGLVNFSLTGLDADLDLYLYENNELQPVAFSNEYGNGDEFFSFSLTGGASYFIQVDPFGGASDYNLHIDTQAINLALDDIPLIDSGLSNITEVAIQQIFVGLLGRPVAQGGLSYWKTEVEADNNFGLTELMSNIVNEQPEYINAFSGLSRTDAVSLHFNYLFSREPFFNSEGKNYWIDGEGLGIPTDQLVLALLLGALGDDKQTISNKMFVADYISNNEPGLTSPAGMPVLGAVTAELGSVVSAIEAVDLFS